MNDRVPHILHRLSWLAPAITVGVLIGLSILLPNRVITESSGADQRRIVAAAVEAVPFLIGEWVSEKIEIPPAAVKLLHPNAMLSRRFEPIGGGPALSLFLVHCTDARDMRGHYPPNCYPNSGWAFDGAREGRPDVLAVDGRVLPVRRYDFRRAGSDGRESRIHIINAFVLPDGTLTRDMEKVERYAERPALAARGVAQLQIVVPATLGEEEAAAAVSEILAGMHDLLDALGVPKEPADV